MKEEQRIPIGVYARAHFKLNFFFAFHVIFNCEKIIIIEHSRGDHSSARWPNICMAEYAREKRIAARHTHTHTIVWAVYDERGLTRRRPNTERRVQSAADVMKKSAQMCTKHCVHAHVELHCISVASSRSPRIRCRKWAEKDGKKEGTKICGCHKCIHNDQEQASKRARASSRSFAVPFTG